MSVDPELFISDSLVRAAYIVGGSERAGAALIGLEPGTFHRHRVGEHFTIQTTEGGARVFRTLGFSPENVTDIRNALDALPFETRESLAAHAALITLPGRPGILGDDAASSFGYGEWLRNNPAELEERLAALRDAHAAEQAAEGHPQGTGSEDYQLAAYNLYLAALGL